MRSGFTVNAEDLIPQMEWRGFKVMETGTLTVSPYLDKPQRQLGAILLPPDPVGLANARPEPYPIDEIWPRLVQRGQPRYLQRSSCSRSLQASTYYQQGAF